MGHCSAAALALPESFEWEILVVDNNPSDQTRKVVKGFCSRYPSRFRYLFEPQPGKSHALNAAIREARSNILAFMAGTGGRIVSKWTCPPAGWLSLKSQHSAAPLVSFDLGPEAGQLNEPPFGTNMAFRREMFEKYRGFRTDLGPRPGSEIRNEDMEFGARLLSAGERLRYEPSAVVYHPVQKNRIEKEYFLRWWFHNCEANIRQFGLRPATKYYVAGIPLFLFRNLGVWTFKWMVGVRPARRSSSKLNVWTKIGEILECHRQSLNSRKRTENYRASTI